MKKKLLIPILTLACGSFCFAQKSSNNTLPLQFTIQPAAQLPEKNVSYHSTISTPLDPLSGEETMLISTVVKDEAKRKQALEDARKDKLAEMVKTSLSISSPKFIPVEANEDWSVALVTSDVKLISVNEKPISDLAMNDPVFTYSYSAVLTVKNKTGEVLLEKVLVDPNQEQKVPKGVLFFNLKYKMKVSMARNNPEKLKKLNDQMMEKKNHLILLQLMNQADQALADAYEIQVKKINLSIFAVKGKPYEELSTLSDHIFDTFRKFGALSKKNRIPKEDVDQVMRGAIPVWEKYIAEHKAEMEENAVKGLLLNCALASTWIGDFEKASGYLDQVPEARKSEVSADDTEGDSAPMGATIFLSFQQSAEHLRDLFENFKEYKSRVVISQ